MKKLKVAFGVFRQQPMTNGHYSVYSQMIRDNDVVIIGLGSIQLEGVANNPFSAKQRTEFIRRVFGHGSKDKIKIVPLRDIGAVYEKDWQEYCLNQIEGKNLPTPTSYYAGSETDLHWWQGAINKDGEKIELINMNRHETIHLSGSLVRQSLHTGTSEWKKHVPGCIVDMIEEQYPKELTLQYNQQLRKEKENER